MRRFHSRLFLLIVPLVVAADQATKLLVVYYFAPEASGPLSSFAKQYFSHFWEFPYSVSASTPVFGEWVKLTFTVNTGMAWGLLHGNSLLLSFVSLAMSAAIYLLWRRFGARSLYLTVSLGLILGGAIGNMIDRFRLQTVVDFVDVLIPVVNYDFPVFNVADFCASVGTLLIAAYLIAADARAARAARLPFDCTAYRP